MVMPFVAAALLNEKITATHTNMCMGNTITVSLFCAIQRA